MSDKFNKTGLASGSSWSLFTKNTDEEDDTEFDIEKQQSFTTYKTPCSRVNKVPKYVKPGHFTYQADFLFTTSLNLSKTI